MKALIVGFGFIGRDLIKAFHEKSSLIEKMDKEFRVTGVSNSKGYVHSEEGLDLERLLRLGRLSEFGGVYVAGGSSVELIEKSGADLMIEATPTRIDDGEPGLTFIRQA